MSTETEATIPARSVGDLIVGEPTPDRMSKVAAICVDLAQSHFDVRLDYDPESIARIDRMIDEGFGSGAPAEAIDDLAMLYGAYIGEIIVRRTRGRWVSGFSREEPASILYLGIGDEVQASVNPFGSVRDKLRDPAGVDLSSFWENFSRLLADAGAA